MSTVQDSAIVLRTYEYSETSQIIVFFTKRGGKVRAIAKGIRRGTKQRFAAGVDLLDVGMLTVRGVGDRGGNLATLTEWKPARGISGLRESLHRIHGGQYAAEVTAHLTEEGDPHPGLFEALTCCLEGLAQSDEPFGALVAYQRAILGAVGSLPSFDRCVDCGRSGGLTHFATFEGGMVCAKCASRHAEKRPVRPETREILAAPIGEAASEGAFALLNHHVAHLIGKMPALASRLLDPKRLGAVRPRRSPGSMRLESSE